MTTYYKIVSIIFVVLAGGCVGLMVFSSKPAPMKTVTMDQILNGECRDINWIEVEGVLLNKVPVYEEEKITTRHGTGGITTQTNVYVPLVDKKWTPKKEVGAVVWTRTHKLKKLLGSSKVKGTIRQHVDPELLRLFAEKRVKLSPDAVIMGFDGRPLDPRVMGFVFFPGIMFPLVILGVIQFRRRPKPADSDRLNQLLVHS